MFYSLVAFKMDHLKSSFYVYVLYSLSSDIYYVGSTNDYDRRLIEHNSDTRPHFSSKHRPWILKLVFHCMDNRALAVNAERFIKKQKSRKFIERLIDGEEFRGEYAQLVRVPLLPG